MRDRRDAADELMGAWTQAAELTFRFLFVAVGVLAVGWLISNCRLVPPESRAVVLRFGSVVREAGAGLLLALPHPIEQVVILPSADRQIAFRPEMAWSPAKESAPAVPGLQQGLAYVSGDPRRNAGILLTGDFSVVHLDATLYYQIQSARDYVLSSEHVAPALARVFTASLMAVTATRDLDAIMVARPEHSGLDAVRMQREQLRADLAAEVNRRLEELTQRRSSLGVRASRVDLVPAIPAEAKYDFDSVLVAVQQAQTHIAEARTLAETITQRSNQERDRMLTDAEAKASERVSRANTVTAAVAAVSGNAQGDTDRLLARRMFQEQVGTILGRAGKVYVTDSAGEARLILPGGPPP